MKFFDLDIKSNLSVGESTIKNIAKFAQQLGYFGIAICDKYESMEKLEELKKAIKEVESDIEIYPGITIQAKDVDELRRIIDKVREKVMIVIVHGGDYLINRSACENPKVDILAHPELGRIDSGLDDICLKRAKENNVAIQVNFREILFSYRRPRSYILNHITRNIRLCNELGAPMIICSGAQNIWDMRDPRGLVAITNVLGAELGKAFAGVTSIPQQIVEENKKILSGKRITKGVEVI
ncbi:MAG: ribonuclease P protein component 3 [Candidatus Aenigmatarchaeota archaeon]